MTKMTIIGLTALIKRLELKSNRLVLNAKSLGRSYSRSVTVRRDTFMKIYNARLFTSARHSGDNSGPREFNQYLDKSIKMDVEQLNASCYYNPEKKEFYYIDCHYNAMHFGVEN